MPDSWSETPSDDSAGFASALRAFAHAPAVALEVFHERLPLAAGTVVDGIFVVERVLGTGGMGVVYLARHEALDREVAIKLCLRRSSERHTLLLLREARAMAALVHPHVVAVHHVGTAAEQVYIAMEYVPGGTLRSWLAARRGWPEVLAMFVQAGRGLAAAHAKGFVHRDFKPDNVLVGEDGRARVTDFGLAINTQQEAATITGSGTGEAGVTRRAGTPRYMAPEQRDGGALGPAADQYAFCLSLREALYGGLPGEPGEGPRPRGLPRGVDAAIDRGLRARPEERHADMASLLRALEPRRGRWRWPTATGAALLAGAVWWRSIDAGEVCSAGEGRVDAVWSASRRAELRAELGDSRAPNARAASELVFAGFDAYADAWRQAHVRACDPAALPDAAQRRAASECLDEALAHFDQAITGLAGGGAEIDGQALTALYALPRLVRCSEPAHLTARVQQQGAPELAAVIAAVRQDLARVQALESGADVETGWRLAAAAIDHARVLGDRGLLAEAQLRAARIGSFRDATPRETVTALEQSYLAAEAAGADQVRAEAGALLVYYIGVELGDYQDALAWARRTEAVVERLGELAALESMSLYDSVGRVYAARGELAEAAQALQRSEALALRTHGGDHPATSSTRVALGRVWMRSGRYDEAAAVLQLARAGSSRALGPDHPEITLLFVVEAELAEERGDDALAESLLQRALARREAEFGPEHTRLVAPLNALGRLYSRIGRDDAALAAYGRARRLCEQGRGAAHLDTAWALVNEAQAVRVAGEPRRALDLYGEALTRLQAHRDEAGEVEPRVGRVEAWLDLMRRGSIRGASEQDSAWTEIERAGSLCARFGCEPALAGRLDFARARLLVARGQREAGVALARDTLARLPGERRTIRELRDALGRWLAAPTG
jgi:tetratricopeptide (TPR) repeat protein/tRNA A-37 threonylcarbamoyl transferase component Bud32